MDKIKKFISRKFLIALLVPIALAINSQLEHPLDPEAVKNIVMVVIAYLLGQSAVDFAEAKNGK